MSQVSTITNGSPIRAMIVDDEESGRIVLRYSLAARGDWLIVGEFSSTASAREFLLTSEVDVIFLDIQMPVETGLGLARSISQMARPPLIIFVTAYNAHAIEAFEVHALDYLLKPVSPMRLSQALGRADEILTQRRGYAQVLSHFVDKEEGARGGNSPERKYLQQIVARSVGEMECVPICKVLWIASASNYVELHLEKRVVLHRMTLTSLEQLLDPANFMRVHRSAIVRIDQLQQLRVVGDGSYLLTLICGAEVAVSERYVDKVRTYFKM